MTGLVSVWGGGEACMIVGRVEEVSGVVFYRGWGFAVG